MTFGLLGLLCLMGETGPPAPRAGPALAAGAFGLAVLCKEAAIVWPVVAAAYGWLFRRPRAWRRYLASFVVVGAWAVAFPFILRRLYEGSRPAFVLEFHPAALLTAYAAYLLSFLNLLVPDVDPEKAGWAMPPRVVELAESPAMMLVMAVLLAVLVAALLLARLRPSALGAPARIAAFGLAWFVVATAPFAVLADRLFMRYSYAGHVGLALSVGGVGAAIAQRWRGRARSTAPSAPPGPPIVPGEGN